MIALLGLAGDSGARRDAGHHVNGASKSVVFWEIGTTEGEKIAQNTTASKLWRKG